MISFTFICFSIFFFVTFHFLFLTYSFFLPSKKQTEVNERKNKIPDGENKENHKRTDVLNSFPQLFNECDCVINKTTSFFSLKEKQCY